MSELTNYLSSMSQKEQELFLSRIQKQAEADLADIRKQEHTEAQQLAEQPLEYLESKLSSMSPRDKGYRELARAHAARLKVEAPFSGTTMPLAEFVPLNEQREKLTDEINHLTQNSPMENIKLIREKKAQLAQVMRSQPDRVMKPPVQETK